MGVGRLDVAGLASLKVDMSIELSVSLFKMVTTDGLAIELALATSNSESLSETLIIDNSAVGDGCMWATGKWPTASARTVSSNETPGGGAKGEREDGFVKLNVTLVQVDRMEWSGLDGEISSCPKSCVTV